MGRSESHASLKWQRYMTFTPPYKIIFIEISMLPIFFLAMQDTDCMVWVLTNEPPYLKHTADPRLNLLGKFFVIYFFSLKGLKFKRLV